MGKITRVVVNTAFYLSFFISSSLYADKSTHDSFVNQAVSDSVIYYNYPRISPKSTDYKVWVNGKEVFVYNTSAAPFAAFSCRGTVNIKIQMPNASENVTISPYRNGIKPVVDGKYVTFELSKPMSVVLKIDNFPQLFIYANPIKANPVQQGDSTVRYFKGGQVYEVGKMKIKDNETLYIEGGAIVRGCIMASGAKNVHITGYGILDGSYYRKGIDEQKSILLANCKNSIIEDIIMIEPSSWMIVLGGCQNVMVKNVKELGAVSSSDGLDIVGSKSIKVENCCFRNGDDCIAIKALDMNKYGNFSQDVVDVEVSGCSLLSYNGAGAFEIGHELRTSKVTNVRYHDCDILGVHGFGSAFGIHNSDSAIISNISYENINVEHYYDKLIDMRIIKSRYSHDQQRGKAHDIYFKNINISVSPANPGYSVSLIGGYDAEHKIKNVVFDNFRLNNVKVVNADQLDLFTKQAADIKFK